jgi:hypothetical protein
MATTGVLSCVPPAHVQLWPATGTVHSARYAMRCCCVVLLQELALTWLNRLAACCPHAFLSSSVAAHVPLWACNPRSKGRQGPARSSQHTTHNAGGRVLPCDTGVSA